MVGKNAVLRLIATSALGVLAATVSLGACGGEPVGRICDLGLTPGATESDVASPSLDCVSRTCLKIALEKAESDLPPGSRYPTGNLGLCTDRCSEDSDCERVPESPCQSGFTCAIAVEVGPFCCEKFCICKDYIVLPADGVRPTPQACNPDDMNNRCCNLPNRRGNPQFPACT
jgi:hypothetical protein